MCHPRHLRLTHASSFAAGAELAQSGCLKPRFPHCLCCADEVRARVVKAVPSLAADPEFPPPRSITITRGADGLIAPHGGKLVDLLVKDKKEAAELVAACGGRTIELSDRGACDVELLTVGCATPPSPPTQPGS